MKGLRGTLGRFIVIVTVIVIAYAAVHAGGTLTPCELKILTICEGVVRLFDEHPADIWPGYDLSERPFIVYVPEKWALLFNCSRVVEDFGPYPDDWPDLGTQVLYRQGRYKDLVGQLAFNVRAGPITTFAVGVPEKMPESLDDPELAVFGYIVHEGFHQYQRETFGEIPWAREERYPIQDTENSALAYLEAAILVDALEASKIDDSGRCRELLKLFVAVRNQRWEHADPFVAKYEQGQEINEGTAMYVEIKSIDLMSGLRYESSLGGLTEPLKDSFQSISMADYLIGDFGDRMGDGFVPPEDMPRNRIYPVGSAQGFLLDYIGIDWKGMAQAAGPDFTYAALFQERLGVASVDFKRLSREAKRMFDYDHIRAATSRSIEEHQAGYREALTTFHDQEGHRIEVDFYYTGISRSRTGTARKWIVDNGTRTLCKRFDVYTLKNNDLALQLHNTGVLEKNDWDNKRKTVVFYITELDTIILDDGATSAEGDFQRAFETIELRGAGLSFFANTAGTINSMHGDITIALGR